MADQPSRSGDDGPAGTAGARSDDPGVRGDGAHPDGSPADGKSGTGAEPTVLGVDSAGADEVLGAVSSATARRVLAAVHEEPSTASGVAERTDVSLETAGYHLESLREGGLVAVVGTETSEKGREMDVYGPTEGPVVVVAGDEDDREGLRATLSRLGSAVGLLALTSLLVQEVLGGGVDALFGGGPGTAGAAATAGGLEPGVAFFAGGLLVVAGWLAVGYLRGRPGGSPEG